MMPIEEQSPKNAAVRRLFCFNSVWLSLLSNSAGILSSAKAQARLPTVPNAMCATNISAGMVATQHKADVPSIVQMPVPVVLNTLPKKAFKPI